MMYVQFIDACLLNLHMLYGPFFLLFVLFVKGAICLARSLKIINECLKSLDLCFNEIRVRNAVFSVLAIGSSLQISTTL
jgi:hypothetical protein